MIADEAEMASMMAAAQKGDAGMYRALLAEVQLWLERYYRKRVAPAQLDDLVQEVMLAVHHKRATWDPGRAFYPWLAAIARYRWVDHLRKVYRSAEDELGDHDAPEDSEEEAVMARMSLERLFVHLPEKQVEVIELVKIEGLSIAEASAKTGQSESLVKVNIHRGLKKLSALVEKAE
ncbi:MULTISPECIES: sigma-70 family RNA polymerase sigma factor [Qipengyuania]|uniref:Sigma-70 family RNA polymerase sigma factor n=2 Tax=Qipengyuania TaxID=1855416 RepID=A0A9Q3XCH6_9SPHN|nr:MULTISPECIES: sigma-70 family RNA polymerase sigma factor [Qipengyuania]MBY6216776.1 sigma-70 family RNA polymerase sigma factor [Qipengyuania aquimaris]QZD91881.1 sigma-70 family RNA polymerase sigma factor [Qipengyuania xiapuensis]